MAATTNAYGDINPLDSTQIFAGVILPKAVFPPKSGTMVLPPFNLAPSPFNFKVYAETHCFTTVIDQMSCTTDALLNP